ncbi:MAG: hypothetical protein ABI791_04240 [Acidobacteriota bacterium]
MKINLPSAALVLLILAAAASAQTVTITPKKTIYRRAKPMQETKKTFTVRRPIARAASPAVSRSITAAISPEKVLDLNVKDELNEYQWLYEADYKVIFNGNGLICVNLWMEGVGAYPDSVDRYVTVRTTDGRRLAAADLFIKLPELAANVRTLQRAEIRAATAEIKKDPEASDIDTSQLFSEASFAVKDLDSYFLDSKGVTFVYDYGFPHVIKAIEPAGEFRLPWARLKPFIKPGGLLERFVR